MLSYPEYLKKCRATSDFEKKKTLEEFYSLGVHVMHDLKPIEDCIKEASEFLSFELEKAKVDETGLLRSFSKIHDIPGVQYIGSQVASALERELYGCHLFVDKIYCYRTEFATERKASWLWHYDGNPDEMFKIMIYLNDVDEEASPFEYLVNKDGGIEHRKSTRVGNGNWRKAPFGSRISENEIAKYVDAGGHTVKVTGPQGTRTCFNNNIVHRGNIPVKGKFRDCMVLRVRPTLEPVESYVDPRWTTGFDLVGEAPMNPDKKIGVK